MTASLVPLSAHPNALILKPGTFQPDVGATAMVYAYVAPPATPSTSVTVYADATGTTTLSTALSPQPIPVDSNGLLVGYVAAGQDLAIVASQGGVTAPPAIVVPLRALDLTPLGSNWKSVLAPAYAGKGDGSTLNDTAIAAADAAAAADGTGVFFPPGTYLHSASLSPSTNWYFAPGAKLKKSTSFSGTQAILLATANVTLHSLTQDGSRTGGAAGQGIVCHAAGCVLVRPTVQHNALTGIRSENSGSTLDIYDGYSGDNQSGSGTADGFYAVTGGLLRLHGDCQGELNDRHGCFISNGAAQGCWVNGKFNSNNGSASYGVLIREAYGRSKHIEVRDNAAGGLQLDFGASRWRFGKVDGQDQGLTAANTSSTHVGSNGGYDNRWDNIVGFRAAGYAVALAGYHVSATTLNGAITNSVTTIPLTSTTGLPTSGAQQIEDEIVTYTGISSGSLTGCVRGAFGTAPVSHLTLASVLNPQQTTLSGSLGTSDVTINVASTANFPSAGLLRHAGELITYEGVTPTSFTGCARGAFGTTAATGASGDPLILNHGCRSCDIGRLDTDNQGNWDNDPAIVFSGASSHNTVRKLRAVGHTFAASFGEQPMPNGNDWNIIGDMVAEQCSFGIVKINRGSHNRFAKIKARDCWNTNTSLANALLAYDPTQNTGGAGVVTDNVCDSFEHITILRPAPAATITSQNGASANYIAGSKSLSLWAPGSVLETFARDRGPGVLATTLTSGTLYLFGGIVIPAGQTISNIIFYSGTTALATGTHQWFCLVDQATLKIVAITGDDTSNAWAASTPKTLALANQYVPSQDQAVYVGLMVAATTPPTLVGISTLNNAVDNIAGLNPKLAGSSSTGQTTPPAVGTTVSGLTGVPALYAYANLS